MSIATFLYQEVYCRYLAPGEAVIHDRGSEFCNEVSKILHESFGVDIRIISAGRPQGNGQAEAFVKNLKQKMICLMSENRNIHQSLQTFQNFSDKNLTSFLISF